MIANFRHMNAAALKFTPWLITLISFLIGLGFPKTFSLLYIIYFFIAACFFGSDRNSESNPPSYLLLCSASLAFFGITHSAIQILHGVWTPLSQHLGEIIAIIVLPAAGLLVGWMLNQLVPRQISKILFAYALGSLTYALLAVLVSHNPAWNMLQTFSHVLVVPWGNIKYLSTRAVEQRAFLLLGMLPLVFSGIKSPKTITMRLRLVLVLIVFLGLYVNYSTQSRIGFMVIYLSFLPVLLGLGNLRTVLGMFALTTSLPLIAFRLGWICDERVFLQIEFIRRMYLSPMGGRLISFPYKSCIQSERLVFGSFPSSSSFTPHNVILDIYNDSGIIPFCLLLVPVASLLLVLLSYFIRRFRANTLNLSIQLRWSIFCLLITQWMVQPFLYTDQLMFSLGFLFTGLMFSEDAVKQHG